MSRAPRPVIGIVLPLLAIAVFAVLLAFSLMRLTGIERDMRIEASQNMVWVISRAHISALQLGDAALRRSSDTADQAELDLRHDVFLSRIALLNEGPQRRQMEALGFGGELDAFDSDLKALSALIAGLGPGDRRAAADIRGLLDPHAAMLGRAGNSAMVAEWDELGERLDTSREQVWHIIISLAGISLAGGFLSVHLLIAVRQARRRARLVERERAFSELLIGSSGDGIMAVDRDRRCTVWNEAMERLFAYSAIEATGRALGDISGFFQIDRIEHAVERALIGHPSALHNQPLFRQGSDGPLYIDLRCFTLRDGARIIGAVILVSDVTERHAAQREIARHRDHLEELVRARTRELDAALERERAAADLYRNFAAMVSHQFRTPLAIIDSTLQRLLRRSGRLSPGELENRGDKARRAIARLTQLVDTTLDAARLDAGQIEIRSRPCDIAKLAGDLCAQQQEAAPGRQIILKGDETGPVIARCDLVHVEQILVNLLTNAVKYSPQMAPVTVRVSTDGIVARCSVSNQGEIAQTDRDRLFERCFRGSNTEGLPGTGLGLFMARTLARMQGGDVQLAETCEQETTFLLTLPLEPSPAAEAHLKKAPRSAEQSA